MGDPDVAVTAREEEDRAAHLLRRWQEQGDTEALDELLHLEVAVLKSRLRGRGVAPGPPVSASDIAQEAVARFLDVDSAPRFDHPRALRAYLWTAAWRLLARRLQSPERRALRIDEMESWDLERGLSTSGGFAALDARERSLALDLALNLLKPAEREVLRLAYLDRLGIEGAAERLGIGRDAAKMRLVRARRELARKLCRWEEAIESP
jgi:RNA polymerase sigma factor (sigma-70 family)